MYHLGLHDLCLTLIAYKEGTPLLVYQKNQEETSTIEIDIGLRKMMDIYRGRPELIIWQELWRMYREQLDDHFNKIRVRHAFLTFNNRLILLGLQELTDRLLRHRAAQRLRELPQRGNRDQNLRHGTFQASEIFAALRDPGSPESQSEDAQKDKEPKFDKTFMILIYLKKIQIFKFKKFQTLLRT